MGSTGEYRRLFRRKRDIKKFEDWAFGHGTKVIYECYLAWNRLHGDIFTVNEDEEVFPSLVRMISSFYELNKEVLLPRKHKKQRINKRLIKKVRMPRTKKDLIEFENWAFGRRAINWAADMRAWNNLHGDLRIFKKADDANESISIMNSLHHLYKAEKETTDGKEQSHM